MHFRKKVSQLYIKGLESIPKHFITTGLVKWQFKPNWEKLNHEKYDKLTELGAIVTAECVPICPGYNLSYMKTSLLDSLYEDLAITLPAWVDYARDFGIEFHSQGNLFSSFKFSSKQYSNNLRLINNITHYDSLPDAPLDHAEIRPGILLKGELKPEPVAYETIRNMTMFVIVDPDDYKRQRLKKYYIFVTFKIT